MKRYSITIEISAPPARVWEIMSDVERWHEWTPSITSVKRLGNGAFGVGSRALVRQPKFPPGLWTVSELVPGVSFTWTASAPGFRAIGYHAVEPAPAGSRASLAIEYHGVFGGLFARFTEELTQRYIAYEANGLKARSENPGYQVGAA